MIKSIETKSIVITLIISFISGLISIKVLGEYGLTLFILIPAFIGFLPPYITSKQKRISRNKAYGLSFKTLGLACLCLLLFAIEGIICIAMASPILALLTLFGSYLAYIIQGEKIANSTNTAIIFLFGTIGLMGFDTINAPKGLIPVKTKIIVNADIHTVWENVVTFNKIDEPEEWIFKTGISYPTNATIEGKGVGAIRYCNFTTGPFVEPITTWDEPNLLQFEVTEQPIPMNEFNPFWEIHPPHLDGYFKSFKGQFKLTEIGNNKTELEGTTWYQVDITPEKYWSAWSDFIIHKIHLRVLEHIKREAEDK